MSISPSPIRRTSKSPNSSNHKTSTPRRTDMRFMVMVKATKDSEAGVMPTEKLMREMGNFNEELVKAGVMLAGEGLKPSSKGARVRFDGRKRTVIDGPFAETKELVAGFWLLQCKSLEEVDRVDEALPESDRERRIRNRDSPGVRSRRFRRRVHARASRAGRAPARRDRQAQAERIAQRSFRSSSHRRHRRRRTGSSRTIQVPCKRRCT